MEDFVAYLFYYSVLATVTMAWVFITIAVVTEIVEWRKRK